MIILKSPEEIAKMRRAGRIVARTIDEVTAAVRPGITTQDLDCLRDAASRPDAMRSAINYYRAAFRSPDARGVWPHWLARFLYGDRPPPEATRTLDDWPKIAAPTLLVWAEADVALGKELTLGMEPLFRGPLEIKYVPLSGHWVQQEQPELVNGYLLDFLGDLAPAPAGAPLFPG